MRRILFITFLLSGRLTFCQTIEFRGIVYEHNSKTKTGQLKIISDAQVVIPKSVPVTTDIKGKFKTVSDGLIIGESVPVKFIKNGFKVVNSKEIETVFVGRKEDLVVFMASTSELQKAQLEYYNLAKKSIESAHLEKIKLLNSEVNNLKIQKDEYFQKIKKLEFEKEVAVQTAQNLANQLSEINLDFASDILIKAVNYYKKGDIDSCLKILYSNDYKETENKVLDGVEDLRKGMTNAGTGIKTIIDKEFLLAKIYSTTLQQDSINATTSRIVNLCIKNSDILSSEYIIKVIKQVTKFDPTGNFSWNNEESFEDLLGLVRLKSGRNSLDEAEMMRMFGYMLMLKNKSVESYDKFIKALGIHKKLNNSDSALIIINLVNHQQFFERTETEYDRFFSMQRFNGNKGFIQNPYRVNPYFLGNLFNDVEDMQYAFEILIEESIRRNDLLSALQFCDFFIRVYLESENQNNFNPQKVSKYKALLILLQSQKSKRITDEDLITLVGLLKEINPYSLDFLNLTNHFSRFLIDNDFCYYLDKNLKDSLLAYCSDISANLSNEFYMSLDYKELVFSLNFCKSIISFYLNIYNVPKENDLVLFRDNLYFLIEQWLYLPKHKLQYYTFYMEKIIFLMYGCNYDIPEFTITASGFDSFREFLKELTKNMSSANSYRGLDVYKNYILHSTDCGISVNDLLELLKSYDKDAESDAEVKERDYYMTVSGSSFNQNFYNKYPVGIDYHNHIVDFYYGSEYGKKISKYGTILEADNWNITNYIEISPNYYDSLWKINWEYAKKGDVINYNNTIYELKKNTYSGWIRNTSKIDRLKFFGDTMTYGPLILTKPSDAFCVFFDKGNSALFDLDEIYNKLAWHYDENSIHFGGYSKNLELVNRYQNFGLPDFFLGHAKVTGSSIAKTGNIFFFGLKSAMVLNKIEEAKKIESNILEIYQLLSEASKVRFLNDVLFLTFDKNQIKDEKNPSYVNFNNAMFNQFYNDLAYLLKNEASWKLDLKGEDKAWPFERDNLILEALLTLSGASQLDNFDPKIFDELKIKYPNEARVYRNEALYFFQKGEDKLAIKSLDKVVSMGFNNKSFFLDKIELKKYHSKINSIFNRIK